MKKSFSLIELTVAIGILVVGILGVISSYIGGAALTDTTKNIALTSNAAAAKLEYMRRETLGSLSLYDHDIFPSPEEEGSEGDIEYQNLNYRGIIYIDNINSQLKQITIIMCWRQGQRTIGEDWVFEVDANPAEHPRPNSPVIITTLMTGR